MISPSTTNNTNKLIYNNFNEMNSDSNNIDNIFKAINFGGVIGNLIIKCKIFKNNNIDKEYTIKFYKNNKENIINVTGYNINTQNNFTFYSESDELIDVCLDSGSSDFNRFADNNYTSSYQIGNGIILYPNIKQENINILDYPFGITTSEIVETAIQSNDSSTNGSSIPTSSKIRIQAVKNSSGTYDIIEIIE
jgi:predicted small secreted protein